MQSELGKDTKIVTLELSRIHIPQHLKQYSLAVHTVKMTYSVQQCTGAATQSFVFASSDL
jgi:hypothetical protein